MSVPALTDRKFKNPNLYEFHRDHRVISIKILFSCEELPEKGFASLINRPRARRRPRARTSQLRLAHSRAPGIGKDQSAGPVS